MSEEYSPIKGESNPWVMYLIVKESLNMSAGKIASQCGHAVGMIYEKYETDLSGPTWSDFSSEHTKQLEQIISNINDFISWQQHGHRKVVLKADDKEFEKVKQELESSIFIVKDAGLTEIQPGETVIALWPARKNSFSKTIKRLQVLK